MARKPKTTTAPPAPPDPLRNDELLNEQQVLELLGGISRAQLRNMRERREVSYVRMGSGCRYYRSSVVAWVLRNTINVGEHPK